MRRTATVLLLGALAAPALAAAQGHGRKTRRITTSAGEVALPANPGRASAAVERFQTLLRAEGCDPGRIDGIIGPRTSRAIACARRKDFVPSASGAAVDTGDAEPDVFLRSPSRPAAGAVAPNPPAPNTTRTIVTGIPLPSSGSARDSSVAGRRSARDSAASRVRRGNPQGGRTPPVAPDTSRR